MPELPAPEDHSHPEAHEVLRVWLVDGELRCPIQPAAFEEASDWGAIFADLTREIALALEAQEGKDAATTRKQIMDAFIDELINDPPPESQP